MIVSILFTIVLKNVKPSRVIFLGGRFFPILEFIIIFETRGHARFARSPLVIRLGDSRIRRGNSGYGEVLSSGWH